MRDIGAAKEGKRKAYIRSLPVCIVVFLFALFWGYVTRADMSFNLWAFGGMTVLIAGAWALSFFDRVSLVLVDNILLTVFAAYFLAKSGWIVWFAPTSELLEVAGTAPFVICFLSYIFWVSPDRRRATRLSIFFLALLLLVVAPKFYRWIEAGENSDLVYVFVLSLMAAAIQLLILQAYGEKERWVERTLMRTSVEARNDPLTEVYNRRGMEAHLEVCREAFERQGAPFSLMLTDLDRFKLINDVHGHNVGDEVLCEVARTLRAGVRDLDHVGRWGGEEFLLLMPGTRLEQAASLAERLREAIEEGNYPRDLRITASFGVAEFQPGDEIKDSVARADAALYKAKERGRNQVEGCVVASKS